MIKINKVYCKSPSISENYDILKNIDLEIEQGSFVSVIGRNGSGKTTLGRLIKGLIQPTSGEISVNGEKGDGIDDNVGYIFTNPENQIVHPVVEDDIAFGLENIMFDEAMIAGNVESALTEVDMFDFLKAQIHWLSKGEQQKVVFAGIIALDHDVIIFDEATSMLDAKSKEEFMKIVMKLNKVDKRTIIFITHDMRDAMYADKVLLLDSGQIAYYGSKKEFFNNEELKKEYNFDFPDIVNLVNFYNRRGYEMNYNNIPAIAGKLHKIIKDKLH